MSAQPRYWLCYCRLPLVGSGSAAHDSVRWGDVRNPSLGRSHPTFCPRPDGAGSLAEDALYGTLLRTTSGRYVLVGVQSPYQAVRVNVSKVAQTNPNTLVGVTTLVPGMIKYTQVRVLSRAYQLYCNDPCKYASSVLRYLHVRSRPLAPL